jgi:hypothetical protein
MCQFDEPAPPAQCPPEILASSSLCRGSQRPCHVRRRVASHGVPESKIRRNESAKRSLVLILRDTSVPSHHVIGRCSLVSFLLRELVAAYQHHGHAIAPHQESAVSLVCYGHSNAACLCPSSMNYLGPHIIVYLFYGIDLQISYLPT